MKNGSAAFSIVMKKNQLRRNATDDIGQALDFNLFSWLAGLAKQLRRVFVGSSEVLPGRMMAVADDPGSVTSSTNECWPNEAGASQQKKPLNQFWLSSFSVVME